MEFMMGAVGPDDDEPSGNNVFPFSKLPSQRNTDEKESQEQKIVASIASPRRLSNAIDVMENETRLSYIVQDILPNSGLIYIGGLSGTGKTILAIQLTADIINGRPCMTWQLGEAATSDMKAIIFSLEMNELELGERFRHMYPNLNDDERKAFQEKFITYAEPDPFKLWEPAHQLEFMRTIKASGATVVLIDSASVSFGEEMNNQAQVNKSIDFLRMIRASFNWAMIVVCHTRKPPAGIASNPEDVTINDLFGHSGVAQSASSIIVMMEDEKQRRETIKKGMDQKKVAKKVHVVNCKARFGANGGAFLATLTSKNDVDSGQPLMFRRKAIAIEMTDEQREAIRNAKTPGLSEALGDIFGSIDLGSPLGDDDD